MIEWTIEQGLRCDIVMYGAPNMVGKRAVMQCFPAGNRKGGNIAPTDLRSMVIRAPLGTRITLRSSNSDLWEELPWRTVRMIEGSNVPGQRSGGLPGIRIPDLDAFDEPDAKRTNRDGVSTIPTQEGLVRAWTFGRPGPLSGKVRVIDIRREGVALQPLPIEVVARDILAAVPAKHRKAALEAALWSVEAQLTAQRRSDASERLTAFREWADQLD